MKCLSVAQPWASAIFQAGKMIENRTFRTRHRGDLAIHASLSKSYRHLGIDGLPMGVLIGVVELVDCVKIEDLSIQTQWAEGPWCWILGKPRCLKVPVPLKGRLGLYDIDGNLLEIA